MEKESKKHFWDCSDAVTRTTPRFMLVSEILSMLVFLGGIAVLGGWVFDIPALKSVFPHLVAMKANTALCFACSGASLWLIQAKRRDDRRCQKIAQVLSITIFVIGLLTFLEYTLRCNLRIDQLLFKELPGAIFTYSPGRMAFNTSINFTLAGFALFLLAFKTKGGCLFSQILVVSVGMVSILAFVGYLYGASPLILGRNFSTAMALHTTALFILLSFGIIYCRPGCGLMTQVTSDAMGGKLIRRMFPVIITIPVLLGGLKLFGEKAGWINNELGVSFDTTANLVLAALYIYAFSFWANRVDSERIKSEAIVRQSEEKYRSLFENSRDAIMILQPPFWKFVSGNLATIEMFRAGDEKKFISLGPWDLSPEQQPDGRASSEKTKKMIQKAVEEGFCFFEWIHKRLDGGEFPATVLLTRIGVGAEMIVLANVRDITHGKREENELKKKITELENFKKIVVGREIRMIELKEKIKALEEGKK